MLVEFWATWCPPCRPTLSWLGELRRRYGDKLAVIAVAIESEEADVRAPSRADAAAASWTMGNPELVRAFGDVTAVPTLLLFDGEGRAAASWLGAPPSLHAEVETKLESLAGAGDVSGQVAIVHPGLVRGRRTPRASADCSTKVGFTYRLRQWAMLVAGVALPPGAEGASSGARPAR